MPIEVIEVVVPATPAVIEVVVPGPQGPSGEAGPASITLVCDGGGDVILPGVQGDIVAPYDMIIQEVTLLADQAGSIVFDIWADAFGNFPPTAVDSICGASKPTITADTKSIDGTLTGWTTTITQGTVLRLNVDSASGITRCSVALKVVRQGP